MPGLTFDTINDRTRALASRTGDQVNRTMSGLLPAQVTRRRRANRLQDVLQGARGLVDRTPIGRTLPPAQKASRRARKVAKQTGSQLDLPDVGVLLQRGALIFAGTRLATDWVWRLRRVTPSGEKRTSLPLPGRGRMAARGGRTSARTATGAARTGTKLAAKAATGTVRTSYRIGVGVGTAKTAMRTAKTAGRGWWLFRRAQAQRQLRRGWKWARAFTIGFATGAIWAYLFAPRQGPGYQRIQAGAQRSA